jgi:PAS domain S-box-containing protein
MKRQILDRHMFWRIIFPALTTFAVFAVILFFGMLPFVESRSMTQKRLQLQELIQIAHADLALHAEKAAAGLITRAEAQKKAIEHLRYLRYGEEGKDYFWINDMHPRMIMHPYRPDLEGADISDFTDPRGKHLFAEAVGVVKKSGAGYIEYMWQWKDDPKRIVPKISYVRGFEPWGWIIGTGIYIEDVREELAGTRRMLSLICLAILLLISLLCAFLIREAHGIDQRRQQAEQEMRDSEERFRALAEGSVDVIMRFDLDHRHLYVNPAVEKITGMPAADFIGKSHDELGYPADLVSFWKDALDTVIETGRVYRTEFTLPNGVWLDWILVPEFAPGGKVSGIITSARDISERKKVETELEKEKRFSETVLESLPGLFFVYRIENGTPRLIQYNRNHAILTGYLEDELNAMTPSQLLAPEDQPCVQQAVAEILEKGESQVRASLVNKNGSTTPYDFYARKLDAGDDEGYILGVGIDISDSLKAQEALVESENRYHALFENANDAIMVLKDGVYMMCNAKTNELFGCTDAEILGQTPFDFSPPLQPEGEDSREESIRKIDAAMAGRPQRFEWCHRRADGTLFDADVSLNVIDVSGEKSILAIVRDITERKQTETALRQFALVIEQASEIVVITDIAGNITYVNPAFEQITGYRQDEVIGKNPRILKSGKVDPETYRNLWETISRGAVWSGRLVNRKKDGTIYTEEATISPLWTPGGKVRNYVGVKRDVSHELELEEQFFQAQKMEAIGQLAGGVAHDFNNLLQVILGYGGMVLDAGEEGGKENEMLKEMMDAAGRARTLVRQLLAFSRKQVLELENVDLGAVVSDMAKMITRIIGEHITFNIASEPGGKRVLADKGQLEQVLLNLCVNARDAMDADGRLTIETGAMELDEAFCEINAWARPGKYVLLSVSDTGCGMDEETRKHIFEPFYTTKGEGKGTGLGLATVFGIIRQHKGMIHVYSEKGAGTIFRIYFPFCEEAECAGKPAREPVPRGGTETILLADDDTAVCMVAEAILRKAGYTVLTARDGEEAIALYGRHADAIALAILDVVMPKLGGRAVFDHIRKKDPELSVLFSSGYSAGGIHRQFVLEEGMQLIQKPYKYADLLRKIRQLLDA